MRSIIFIFFLLISGYIKGETVFGKVMDETNHPLPFVTITVEGKSLGTMSDIDGNYSLELSDETNTIVFSFIGYDELKIQTTLISKPNKFIEFEYVVYKDSEVINEGYTKLVFLDRNSKKPIRCPKNLLDVFNN